jgi:hypothetical protein
LAVDPYTFLLAFREVLRGRTMAGARIFPGTGPVEEATRPQITIQEGGAIPVSGYTVMERMRVRVDCYGRDDEEARKLYGEVRDVLLPPEHPAYGYYGEHTVTVNGEQRVVHISGVEHNAGPENLTDLPTQWPFEQSFWTVPHF